MANMYAVSEEQLTNIAQAIRLKRDITDGISVDDMPMQIGLIDGGGSGYIDSVTFEYELAEDYVSTSNTELVFSIDVVSDMFSKYIGTGNDFVNGRVLIYNVIIENSINDNFADISENVGMIFISAKNTLRKMITSFAYKKDGTLNEFGSGYGLSTSVSNNNSAKNGIKFSINARIGASISTIKAGIYKITVNVIAIDDLIK